MLVLATHPEPQSLFLATAAGRTAFLGPGDAALGLDARAGLTVPLFQHGRWPVGAGGGAALQGVAIAGGLLPAFVRRARRGQARGQGGTQMGREDHPDPALAGLQRFLP